MAETQPALMDAEQLSTLLEAADNADRLLELIHGELVEKMPTEEHGKLAALIAHFLLAHVLPNGIQAHVGVEVRHELPDDRLNSRLPDVSLRLSDDAPVKSGPVRRFPDLAVEIQSPTDRPHQMREKALYYLQKGSRCVWLIYPSARHAEICTLDASGNLDVVTLDATEALIANDVLPEFRLPLAQLFDQL